MAGCWHSHGGISPILASTAASPASIVSASLAGSVISSIDLMNCAYSTSRTAHCGDTERGPSSGSEKPVVSRSSAFIASKRCGIVSAGKSEPHAHGSSFRIKRWRSSSVLAELSPPPVARCTISSISRGTAAAHCGDRPQSWSCSAVTEAIAKIISSSVNSSVNSSPVLSTMRSPTRSSRSMSDTGVFAVHMTQLLLTSPRIAGA